MTTKPSEAARKLLEALFPDHREDCDDCRRCLPLIQTALAAAAKAERERLREALIHAKHRNHGYTAGCDGCTGWEQEDA